MSSACRSARMCRRSTCGAGLQRYGKLVPGRTSYVRRFRALGTGWADDRVRAVPALSDANVEVRMRRKAVMAGLGAHRVASAVLAERLALAIWPSGMFGGQLSEPVCRRRDPLCRSAATTARRSAAPRARVLRVAQAGRVRRLAGVRAAQVRRGGSTGSACGGMTCDGWRAALAAWVARAAQAVSVVQAVPVEHALAVGTGHGANRTALGDRPSRRAGRWRQDRAAWHLPSRPTC